MAEVPSLVLCEDDDLPGSLGEALEQRRPKPTPP
jgi:hypothetical protein